MRIIGGTARSRQIQAPPGQDTRPTLDRVRENIFNIIQHRVRGAKTLDLFAGSGAMSLEAVSRGAMHAVMVDKDRTAIDVQKANVSTLHFETATRILHMDWQQAVTLLQREGAQFDLVFLDPPYAMCDMTDVMTALIPLLSPHALILLEHEAQVMPSTADGYWITDHRKYGYAGISFFQRVQEEHPNA